MNIRELQGETEGAEYGLTRRWRALASLAADRRCRVAGMTTVRRLREWIPRLRLPLLFILSAGAVSATGKGGLSLILGTWHGTSTCVDREAAPACKDETVVYEVGASGKPQTAFLKADKIVDGKRVPMGDLEFAYAEKDGCWRAEFTTPRAQGVWCLVVEGEDMTGGLRIQPGNVEVRRVRLKRQ